MRVTTPQTAGRREWIALAVLALPCVVYALDLTVLNLALPALSADLRPSGAEQLWIVDVYGFMVAGLLITMGSLGDRIGRRRVLLIGAAGFGAASVLAAFSTSAGMLIAARALLGIAGATVAPSTLSLITTLFEDARQRTFAVGVWITSYSVGAAIGPLAGGALLEHFWWGSVFLIGLPVSALLLITGPRLLPEYRDPAGGRLGLVSAALSVAAVLSAVYGVKRSFDGLGLAAIAAGLLFGAAFVRRQQRSDDPLLDLRLLQGRRFRAVLGANLVGFFALFGMELLLAQYLQSVLGLSPWVAGLWSLPSALAFVIGALLTSSLVRVVKPETAMIGGLLVAAAGFAGVAGAVGLYVVVAAWFVYCLGLAPVFTVAADLISSGAPPERAGAASALNETSTELGGALGIALLGARAAAIFGPGTIGAAAGDPAAREAFTTALHVTAGVAAGLVAAPAIVLALAAPARNGAWLRTVPVRS